MGSGSGVEGPDDRIPASHQTSDMSEPGHGSGQIGYVLRSCESIYNPSTGSVTHAPDVPLSVGTASHCLLHLRPGFGNLQKLCGICTDRHQLI